MEDGGWNIFNGENDQRRVLPSFFGYGFEQSSTIYFVHAFSSQVLFAQRAAAWPSFLQNSIFSQSLLLNFLGSF